MTVDQLISTYTPGGDITTFVLCAVLMYVIGRTLYLSGGRRFAFLKRAVHFIMFASLANIGFYAVVKYASNLTWLIFVYRDIYHFCLLCCLYCFLLYMKRMVAVESTTASVVTYASRGMFVGCLAIDMCSQITKVGLHVEDGVWYDSIYSAHNLFYMYCIIILFFMLILYSKRMVKLVRKCLVYTEAVVIIIMLGQYFLNTNSYSTITYLLPVLVVLITMHSKPYDAKSGSLSGESFDGFLRDCREKGQSADYMVLKLYLSTAGQIPDELGRALNSFWHGSFREASLFELSNDLFVLAVPRSKKNENNEEKIKNLVNTDFKKYYANYKITYKIVELIDIDFIENIEDIRGILKYLLAITEENAVFITDDKVKKDLRFFKYIKNQLEDIEIVGDLDDPRVLAYCQPIRNMKTGKFDTAEALMRLEFPDYGIAMPYMFIDIAEEYNHIHTLTKIILNKVCKKINEFDNEGFDVDRISVNVAASEIIQDGFCDEVIGIVKNNGIHPSRIGIEITETQNDRDFDIVKRKLKILHEAGFTLYLDDIGTGYSNLDRIVQYDVDVVKFDRFFLLEAEKSAKIVKMMSHLSQAFRDLDYKLLYEGVETEAHEALCVSCGADYIQGFKYSKPVPIDEYRCFLEHTDDKPIARPIIKPRVTTSERKDFDLQDLREQYKVLVTMSKLFYSMHVIDLINNTARPYNPTEDMSVVEVVNSSVGADEMMRQIMRMCTEDEDVEGALEFSDLTTVAERMKGKKVIKSEVYGGRSIGPYIASFITLEADDDGHPTKVVYTTRAVGDDN